MRPTHGSIKGKFAVVKYSLHGRVCVDFMVVALDYTEKDVRESFLRYRQGAKIKSIVFKYRKDKHED